MEKKLWFRAKRYGWGWEPATWQGWTCLSCYIVSIILLASFFVRLSLKEEGVYMFVSLCLLLTGLLIFVCFKKGEKPRWRWGEDKHV